MFTEIRSGDKRIFRMTNHSFFDNFDPSRKSYSRRPADQIESRIGTRPKTGSAMPRALVKSFNFDVDEYSAANRRPTLLSSTDDAHTDQRVRCRLAMAVSGLQEDETAAAVLRRHSFRASHTPVYATGEEVLLAAAVARRPLAQARPAAIDDTSSEYAPRQRLQARVAVVSGPSPSWRRVAPPLKAHLAEPCSKREGRSAKVLYRPQKASSWTWSLEKSRTSTIFPPSMRTRSTPGCLSVMPLASPANSIVMATQSPLAM